MPATTFNAFQELFSARSGRPMQAARTLADKLDSIDFGLRSLSPTSNPQAAREAKIAQQRLERLDKNMQKSVSLMEKERTDRILKVRQDRIEEVDNRRTFYRKLDGILKALHPSGTGGNTGMRWWQLLVGAGLLGWNRLYAGVEALKSIFGTEGVLARLASRLPSIARFGSVSGRLFSILGRASELVGGTIRAIPGASSILGIAKKVFLPITILFAAYDALKGWYDTEGILAAGGDPNSITDRVLSSAASVFTGVFKPLSDFVNWTSTKIVGFNILADWNKDDVLSAMITVKSKIIEYSDQVIEWSGQLRSWFDQQLMNLRDWWASFKQKLTDWWPWSGNDPTTAQGQPSRMLLRPTDNTRASVAITMNPLASEKFGTQVGRSIKDVLGDLASMFSIGSAKADTLTDSQIFNAYQSNFKTRVLPQPTAAIRNSIASAGMQYGGGIDNNYLMAIAGRESGYNPSAKNPTSSASGLFQFTDSTWQRMVANHGAKTGIGVMDKLSPRSNAIMGALFTKENAEILRHNGIEPNNTNLYLAHFLGAEGAVRFLQARSAMPNRRTEDYFSGQVFNANRSLMQNKTLDQFYQSINEDIGSRVAFAQKNNLASTNVANTNVVPAAPTAIPPPAPTGAKVASMESGSGAGRPGPTRAAAARAGTKPLLDDTAILHGDSGLVLVNFAGMS